MTRVLASPSWPTLDVDEASSAGLPEPEAIIGGRYRVLHEIGRGGMGVVFEVAHCVTDVRSALKVMRPELCTTAEAQRRFVREVTVGGRLRHRNLVAAYDAGVEGPWLFLVMELLRGESLEARLQREVSLPAAECARILLPCMRGIAKAHAAGIVHRDLKPANIFLCVPDDAETEEEPKVLDFGVLSNTGLDLDMWVTSRGMPVGTLPYMSVEQLRARPAVPQFDVHAFGVILYQMLSGRLPFQGEAPQDLIVAINTRVPPSLAQLVPGIVLPLVEVSERAMSRDPQRQFGDLSEMIEAFARASSARDAGPSAAEFAPMPAAAAAANRSGATRTWLRMVGAALLLLAAASAYLWHALGRESMPPRAAEHAATASPALSTEPATPVASFGPHTQTLAAPPAEPPHTDVPEPTPSAAPAPVQHSTPRRRRAPVAVPESASAPAAGLAPTAAPNPPAPSELPISHPPAEARRSAAQGSGRIRLSDF